MKVTIIDPACAVGGGNKVLDGNGSDITHCIQSTTVGPIELKNPDSVNFSLEDAYIEVKADVPFILFWSGEYKEVKRVEFADGSIAEF